MRPEPVQSRHGGRCSEGAEDRRRIPAERGGIGVQAEAEAAGEVAAHGHGGQEVLAAHAADRLGLREQRRDERGVGMQGCAVERVLEVERVGHGPVGQRRHGRGDAHSVAQHRAFGRPAARARGELHEGVAAFAEAAGRQAHAQGVEQ